MAARQLQKLQKLRAASESPVFEEDVASSESDSPAVSAAAAGNAFDLLAVFEVCQAAALWELSRRIQN